MTLERLLQNIAEFAINNRLINYSGAGMTLAELNMEQVKDYPALFACPAGAHNVHPNTTSLSVTLYYMDRLTKDRINDINILSSSVEVLKNLINGIRELEGVVYVSEDYDIINFADTTRMADLVAGAYATIRIEVMNDGKCYEE